MVANTEALLIQEVYQNYCLWHVSPQTVRLFRELDLIPVMGNQVNVDEFLSLVKVNEDTDLALLPSEWRNISSRKLDHSKGGTRPGANLI